MRRVLAFAAALAAAITIFPAPAQAHTPTWYYSANLWPAGQSISYGLNTGFPTGAPRDRALDAKGTWNANAGTYEPKIYWTLADDVSYGVYTDACGISSGINTIVLFWANLDSTNPAGTGGVTRGCYNTSTGKRTKVTIVINSSSAMAWYNLNGDTPSTQNDMWSVMSHEFGHAVGAGHLTEGEAGVCPAYENSVRNTMCPKVFKGYEVMRGLGTHDIHTFQAAY